MCPLLAALIRHWSQPKGAGLRPSFLRFFTIPPRSCVFIPSPSPSSLPPKPISTRLMRLGVSGQRSQAQTSNTLAHKTQKHKTQTDKTHRPVASPRGPIFAHSSRSLLSVCLSLSGSLLPPHSLSPFFRLSSTYSGLSIESISAHSLTLSIPRSLLLCSTISFPALSLHFPFKKGKKKSPDSPFVPSKRQASAESC